MVIIGKRTQQVALRCLRTLSSSKHCAMRTEHTASASSVKECAHTSGKQVLEAFQERYFVSKAPVTLQLANPLDQRTQSH